MGFIKDMKAGALATEATKARDSGAALFTPKLNAPGSASGMTGNIADWSQMLEAVEGVGWVLTFWTVGMDTKGRPEAYPVFRRA